MERCSKGGIRKGGMQEIMNEGKERRDSGIEGYGKEVIQERRETRKEGSEQEVCGTGKMLYTVQKGYRKGGMQDRWDRGMQDSWDSGKEECRKGGMQESKDTGKQRYRKGGMRETRDSRDEGCKFGSEMLLIEKIIL